MDQEKKRYVGPNEVSGVVIEGFKTPQGGEIVRVIYVGEKLPPEVMPMKTFEALVTDVPQTYNWVRETRYKPLLDELAAIALERDMLFCDAEYVTTELKKKFAAAFDRATNLLWTGDDEQFFPGIPPLSYRSLLEADRILKEKMKQHESDNTNATAQGD